MSGYDIHELMVCRVAAEVDDQGVVVMGSFTPLAYAAYIGTKRGLVLVSLELLSLVVATAVSLVAYRPIGGAIKSLAGVSLALGNVVAFVADDGELRPLAGVAPVPQRAILDSAQAGGLPGAELDIGLNGFHASISSRRSGPLSSHSCCNIENI